ncbi:hypothetical protein [Avibacterium endocarditidis]|uniref:DUF1983 domain-containing protein n=1 Tax=Avibacterium endocarditidis TaxID=380674 RepID=A0ABX4ZRV8_9PAST|nr:hypothetical protein [Avibacterium endocarditidis]POY42239.1 hypothetical protein C3Z13_06915 [Avibacterium endocarditidis]
MGLKLYVELLDEINWPCKKGKLYQRLAAAQKELEQVQSVLAECQEKGDSADTSALEAKIVGLESEIENLTSQITDLTDLLTRTQSDLVTAQSDLAISQAELKSITAQAESAQSELDSMRELLTQARSELAITQAQLAEARDKAKSIERQPAPRPQWGISNLTVIQTNNYVKAVVAVYDVTGENTVPETMVPDYFWVNGSGSTLEVLDSQLIGRGRMYTIRLTDSHGHRNVVNAGEIGISFSGGPSGSSLFGLTRIDGTNDDSAVFITAPLGSSY